MLCRKGGSNRGPKPLAAQKRVKLERLGRLKGKSVRTPELKGSESPKNIKRQLPGKTKHPNQLATEYEKWGKGGTRTPTKAQPPTTPTHRK